MFNSGRRSKTLALFICVHSRLPEPFDHLDTEICEPGGRLLHSQMGMLEVGVVEAVQQKVYKIRHNRLCAFMLQKINQIIVCRRKEFDKDFSYNSYTGLFLIRDRQSIKVMNDLPAKFFEPASGRISFRDKFPADGSPFFIERIGRSFFSLIRTNPVETPHKDISKDCGIHTAQR